MECNKEEAIRAKGIAEQKMQNGDFEGAKKFALKAQKLFPELDNITQLLAVCNVHYCAKNNIHGSEKDLYGILQIEPLADESLVKKQFRKLALLLHPDKNKFPGAEAAFKLIGEANRILTDQKTRSQYDLKCRVSVKTIPKPTSHPSNKSSTVDNQPDLTNYRNGSSKFTTSNAYQQAQHLVFWTSCSACGFKFQFNKDFVNRMLPCLSCRCIFIAQDLGPQGYPWSQFPSQNSCNSSSQHNSDKPSGVHFPHKFAGSGPIPKADSKKQEKVGVKMNQSKESLTTQKDEFPNMRDRKKGVEMPTATKTEESGTSRKARKKRGRKSVEESDESCETGGGIEVENVVSKEYCNNNTEANSKVSGGNPPRRSSRQKQPVSYEEKLADDDFESPYKKSKLMTPPKANEEKLDDEVMKKYNSGGLRKKEVEHKASAPPEDDVLIKKRKIGDSEGKEEETVILDNSKLHQFDSGFESSRDVNPSLELEYPDPEFTDFEKYRADNCFAVNQVWAIYDTLDGMPRFYARVKKVYGSGFKLQITWLEADPDEENQQDWVELDLPVSCGKYCNGSSETCVDRLMFSHQIDPIKCSSKCFFVYPQKGETWALFKDWDAKWVSEPEKHKPPYDYDFVEVLAGFDEEVGIGVAHLCKVKGFVSIFQQTEHDGVISFHISSCELYRFSHPVPSFRMTGNEREGIPVGSFELDPASLPAYLFELVDSNDMKLGNHNAENCSGPNHPQNQAKATKDSESNLTPVSNQMGETEKEVSASRITREPRCMLKDLGQVDAVHYKNEDDSTETLRDCNLTHPKGSSISDDAIEKTNTPKNCKKNYLTKDCLTPRKSPRDLSRRISQANASQHDTKEDGKKHSVSNKNEKPGSFGNTERIVSLNPPVGHMHQHRR